MRDPVTNPNLPYPRNAEGKLGSVNRGSAVAMRFCEGKAHGRETHKGDVRKGGRFTKGDFARGESG
jgi:hypothetical protein